MRFRKVSAFFAGAVLSACMFLQTGMTAEAHMQSDISSMYGGIASILYGGVSPKEEGPLLAMSTVKVLNVRSGPDIEAEKIGQLYKNCGGIVIERKDGWTKIQSGNMVGWSYDEYLSFGYDVHLLTDDSETMARALDTLNVRAGADTDARLLGRINEGAVTGVLNQDLDGWLHIEYDGSDGYVLADYMELFPQLKAGETLEEIAARTRRQGSSDMDITRLMAALIHCEAGGESYEGQIAVGMVVMNRVESPTFPDNIHDVIYQSGQFTPVTSGKVDRVYNNQSYYESCMRAAEDVLSGMAENPIGGCLYFHRYDGCSGQILGNHVFK